MKAAIHVPGAKYVEGYAAIHSLGIPLEHGWLVTPEDEIVDVTWYKAAPVSYEPIFVLELSEVVKLLSETRRTLPVGYLLRPTMEQIMGAIERCARKVQDCQG